MSQTLSVVDSHCHLDMLDLSPFHQDMDRFIAYCQQAGIQHLLNVSVNLTDFPRVLAIAHQYDCVSASVGVHPNERDDDHEVTLQELITFAADPKVIAIGETGLDYYRSDEDNSWQKSRFICHIEAAKQSKKPLIIHMRNATEDTLAMLAAEDAGSVGGVMHCFAEDYAVAKRAIDLGFYISFSGIVTFKNAQALKEVAQKIPLDRMLIETDSPYLAPTPHRGKANYPYYVTLVAEHIAQLRGDSAQSIAQVTTENFNRLFF